MTDKPFKIAQKPGQSHKANANNATCRSHDGCSAARRLKCGCASCQYGSNCAAATSTRGTNRIMVKKWQQTTRGFIAHHPDSRCQARLDADCCITDVFTRSSFAACITWIFRRPTVFMRCAITIPSAAGQNAVKLLPELFLNPHQVSRRFVQTTMGLLP